MDLSSTQRALLCLMVFYFVMGDDWRYMTPDEYICANGRIHRTARFEPIGAIANYDGTPNLTYYCHEMEIHANSTVKMFNRPWQGSHFYAYQHSTVDANWCVWSSDFVKIGPSATLKIQNSKIALSKMTLERGSTVHVDGVVFDFSLPGQFIVGQGSSVKIWHHKNPFGGVIANYSYRHSICAFGRLRGLEIGDNTTFKMSVSCEWIHSKHADGASMFVLPKIKVGSNLECKFDTKGMKRQFEVTDDDSFLSCTTKRETVGKWENIFYIIGGIGFFALPFWLLAYVLSKLYGKKTNKSKTRS